MDCCIALFVALAVYSLFKTNTTKNDVRIKIGDPSYLVCSKGKDCEKCKKVEPGFSYYKPYRAHHCRHCGSCVLKMDHHCVFTQNCIGL